MDVLPPPPGEPASSLKRWLAFAFLVALLAFGFQGSRGIWEPDEGFYVNASLGMLNTGDWIVPRLNGEPFLDKPPLLYWGSALGMRVLGKNEWGARIPHAIWFSLTVVLVGLMGRQLLGNGRGGLAALVYCTSLLPFLGANVLTPDTVLAFCTALALFCYCGALQSTGGGKARIVWWLAMGAATGLGGLAKGPAVLIFVFPSAVHYLWSRGLRRALLDPLPYAALLVAGAIALPWYGTVASRLPGAARYFLDNQVAGRLMTARYHRNSGGFLSGALYYLPVLAIGALPWSLAAWPFLIKRWRFKGLGPLARRIAAGPGDSPVALLALSVLIPLVVLTAAQSRLPLYVLPLFVPLALATAAGIHGASLLPRAPRYRLAMRALGVFWVIVLIGLKAGAAHLDTDRSSRAYAASLGAIAGSRDAEIVDVDLKLNGLPLYGYTRFEAVTTEKNPYPFFTPIESLEVEAEEMRGDDEREAHLFIVPPPKLQQVSLALLRTDDPCRVVGKARRSILLYCPARPALTR